MLAFLMIHSNSSGKSFSNTFITSGPNGDGDRDLDLDRTPDFAGDNDPNVDCDGNPVRDGGSSSCSICIC